MSKEDKKNETVFNLETASKEEVQAKISELEGVISEQNAVIEDLTKKIEVQDSAVVAKKSKDKKGNVKVRVLLPVAGKFMLPYNVNQVVALPEKQADEIVEARYAEYA